MGLWKTNDKVTGMLIFLIACSILISRQKLFKTKICIQLYELSKALFDFYNSLSFDDTKKT